MTSTTILKDASKLFCPNLDCPARGKCHAGNIVSHGKTRPRYKCKVCRRTFSERQGTMVEGLRKPETVILIVVILLSYGCPPQAIVHAFGIDERTVARWQKRAGLHCQSLHQGLVMQKQLDLEHVQADEIRVKGCKLTSPKRASWLFLLISLSFSHFLAAFAPHPPLLAFSC